MTLLSRLALKTQLGPRVIVALDVPSAAQALELVEQLDPALCRLKVGLEMFTAYGAPFVKQLMDKGFEVFLDLKFHDIPNTVAAACRQVAALGVWMTNVHALGGFAMLHAAKQAIDEVGAKTLLLGVTVLTSHSQADLELVGLASTIDEQVLRLAKLTEQAGLDGVVCSAREVPSLAAQSGAGFCFVTPGIRPSWSQSNDQQRIMTPAQALANGSNYLVIGRPITAAADPLAALQRVLVEIQA